MALPPSNEFGLNREILIRGKRAYVIVDEVTAQTKFTDSLVLEASSPLHEFIWVREEGLIDLRKRAGSAAVYGLWQILIASKLIDYSKPINLVEEDDGRGQYLIISNGRAIESGRYIARQIPVTSGARYDDGIKLDVRLDQLVLPKKAARITSEIVAAQRRANAVMAVTSVLGIALCAGTGFVADQYLDSLGRKNDRDLASIGADSARLQSEVDVLKTQVYEFDPSVRDGMLVALSRFAEISIQNAATFIYIPGKDASNFVELTVGSVPAGLTFPIEAAGQPGVTPKIKLSADGSADSLLNPLLLATTPESQTLIHATATSVPGP